MDAKLNHQVHYPTVAPLAPPTYWVRPTPSGLIELRQSRYRHLVTPHGGGHPHDVCALGRSLDELRDMVDRYKLGTVDWTLPSSS